MTCLKLTKMNNVFKYVRRKNSDEEGKSYLNLDDTSFKTNERDDNYSSLEKTFINNNNSNESKLFYITQSFI